jgi:hypothetical protein
MKAIDKFCTLPQITKEGMTKIIKIVRKRNIPDEECISYLFGGEFDIPIMDYSKDSLLDYFHADEESSINKIITEEFKFNESHYIGARIYDTNLVRFNWMMYFVWASIIYLKGYSNLKEILQEISHRTKVHVYHTNIKKDVSGRKLLEYLTEENNYIQIFPVVKILSEYMDLPLKGKSLEKYKKAIIETCKEMLAEEK